MYWEPLTLSCVAPVNDIELIPTLSVTTAVKYTVCVCAEVFTSIEVSSALKLLMDGFWSSLFEILIVTDSVELLPAASPTVKVSVSVDEPKL